MELNEVEITGTEKLNGIYQVKPEIKDAIARIREKEKEKSFSGRHPELGKMINCQFCDRRHRSSILCFQVFAKDKNDIELIARGHGHGHGRLTRHWNKRSLELVDLTRQLIPFYPNGEADFQKARSRALNMLRKKWHARSTRIQTQQKLSRRINRG